jgi:hypothetical protein
MSENSIIQFKRAFEHRKTVLGLHRVGCTTHAPPMHHITRAKNNVVDQVVDQVVDVHW